MTARVFLLDGMALAYRGHFALMRSPILTSGGLNTSAVFVFVGTLLEILEKRNPTHLAVAFDAPGPTFRHEQFPAYKAQREEMPEELQAALPLIRRILEAFRIPVLETPGWEADDVIGTLARQAAARGAEAFMVTPDKDFAQLVDGKIRILKPGRGSDDAEELDTARVLEKWEVTSTDQVRDILALMGDTSDNVPGVPGIGEKTAKKLIAAYGSVENLLDHLDDLKGKQKENLEANAEQARLCKDLVTIRTDAPVEMALDDLRLRDRDDEALQAVFRELEFNTLGKRLFGDSWRATAQGGAPSPGVEAATPSPATGPARQAELFATARTLADTPHDYRVADTDEAIRTLAADLAGQEAFAFDTETTSLDPFEAELVGASFSWADGTGWYVPFPGDAVAARARLELLRPALEAEGPLKVGHNLKFDLGILLAQGLTVAGPFFDTMIAHQLLQPDQRHGLDIVSEAWLGYTPQSISALIGDKGSEQKSMREIPVAEVAEYAAEDADVAWQLFGKLRPALEEAGLARVFEQAEAPLTPVLAAMEHEGIRLDSDALAALSEELARETVRLEEEVIRLAGTSFNLNSPKQLGTVLFDYLNLEPKPKRTATGQYSTSEDTLMTLAAEHEIVRKLLEYREVAKLKSTYVDALPAAVHPKTGRIHSSFAQCATSTGRLASSGPNLQNIPIRTERGQEIRRAFVPRSPEFVLLSADYSQIELRIMAHLSGDADLRQAFADGHDVHRATAARVYGVDLADVSPEMRRKAKMVNFGIIYGISAYGLAQRLGIGRREAGDIIDQYFRMYPGVKAYMDRTIEFARERGYVETLLGRRRRLATIRSANATVRGAEERNAINAPIQGTAADMIKLAMVRIHRRIAEGGFRTRLLLQVHDELVFDLHHEEEEALVPGIVTDMRDALPLDVPVEVETGTGSTWLEAH